MHKVSETARAALRFPARFFALADTPLQRLGALGLATALAIFAWTAIDWQIGEGFVRRTPEPVTMPRPERTASGHRWERDSAHPFAWRLLDEWCLARQEHIQRKNAGWVANQERQRIADCTRQERPGLDTVMRYKLNLSGYLEALTLFQPYKRAYGSTLATAATLFTLALLAYLGIVDRLLLWVRTGRVEPRRPA